MMLFIFNPRMVRSCCSHRSQIYHDLDEQLTLTFRNMLLINGFMLDLVVRASLLKPHIIYPYHPFERVNISVNISCREAIRRHCISGFIFKSNEDQLRCLNKISTNQLLLLVMNSLMGFLIYGARNLAIMLIVELLIDKDS